MIFVLLSAVLCSFLLLWRELRYRHLLGQLRLQQVAAPALPLPVGDDAPTLALRLPEPQRLYALALLCRLQDLSGARLDSRAAYLVSQSRSTYLPSTLRAYLSLTPTARTQLSAQGHDPEATLREQLELINRGLDDALGQDQAAAQQVLTQGAFLREVFGQERAKA